MNSAGSCRKCRTHSQLAPNVFDLVYTVQAGDTGANTKAAQQHLNAADIPISEQRSSYFREVKCMVIHETSVSP